MGTTPGLSQRMPVLCFMWPQAVGSQCGSISRTALVFPHTELSLRPARPPITKSCASWSFDSERHCRGSRSRGCAPGSCPAPCLLPRCPALCCLGITWRSAPGGLLAMRRVLDPILHRCPPGYSVCWCRPQTRPRLFTGDIWVQDGEIIVLAFLPN